MRRLPMKRRHHQTPNATMKTSVSCLSYGILLAAFFGAVQASDDDRYHRLVFFDERIVIAPADQPLDGVYCVFRIGNALALGRLADEDFAVVGESDNGGRGTAAFGIFDDLGLKMRSGGFIPSEPPV